MPKKVASLNQRLTMAQNYRVGVVPKSFRWIFGLGKLTYGDAARSQRSADRKAVRTHRARAGGAAPLSDPAADRRVVGTARVQRAARVPQYQPRDPVAS